MRVNCGMFALCAALVLTGCATKSMKGTPFYTGEYEQSEGPPSDRVNLWPLLYYRDPALSVLWPIMEFSPDHTALRPLFSVYGRSAGKPVYNVVWPIARFDPSHEKYRIFPVYWGDEYFTVFPLYWHGDDPFAGDGYNALFPIWIWNIDKYHHSLHLMWPFYAYRKEANGNDWRLWPLYGIDRDDERTSMYAAWPLIHLTSSPDVQKSTVIPLYHYQRSPDLRELYTLPYYRRIPAEPGAQSWDLAIPLWYRSWQGEQFDWIGFPLLIGGHSGPDRHSFYSLPWMQTRRTDGSGWNAAFPFYYGAAYSGGEKVRITPLYAEKRQSDGSVAWQCFIPVVYLDETKDAHFMTLLGGRWRNGEESGWIALPLLSGGIQDAESGRNLWVGGLAASKWDAESSMRYVLPIYYSAKSQESETFISPLVCKWKREGSESRAIPLLLSGWQERGDVRQTVVLGGLSVLEKKEDALNYSHVLPLYLWRRNDHLYTPVYGSDREMTYYATPLAGVYKESGQSSGSWIFPLYYHRKRGEDRVNGRVLLAGYYEQKPNRKRNGIWTLYRYESSQRYTEQDGRDCLQSEYTDLRYGFWLGYASERLIYGPSDDGSPVGEVIHSVKEQSFFPLWNREINDNRESGHLEEQTSVLGVLYDTLHEKVDKDEKDYFRRRVLWRLYHHENLNGDKSTDIFPGITIDSYANGYRKTSLFWRLYRSEKDPESGTRKLDLFFIPLIR